MTVVPGTPDPETLFGGFGNDRITADGGNDTVYAQDGNDVVFGGMGGDNIDGYFGNDLLFGGAQNDTLLAGGGIDRLYGGAGDDFLVLNEINYSGAGTGYGGNGNDLLASFGTGSGHADGGDGIDTLFLLALDSTDLTVDLAGGLIDGHGTFTDTTFSSVEQLWVLTYGGNDHIFGGEAADRLQVGTGANLVQAQGGDDHVSYITRGASTLDGGAGHDVLTVTGGGSSLYFIYDSYDGSVDDGQGSQITGFEDYVAYGGIYDDTVAFDAGNDEFRGGSGSDTAFGGAGRDLLDGQAGADLLTGGAGNDRLFGGSQNDTLYGDDGDDFLGGGNDGGADVVYGGDGHDRIRFGLGNDTATGGAGQDSFLFTQAQSGVTTITDFASGVDTLTFTGSYLQWGPPAGPLDPQLLAYGGATGPQAQFVLAYDAGTDISSLFWDPNGDDPAGGSYIYAHFLGEVMLEASDFLIV